MKHRFTLIEIMVVMSIVVVLMALFMGGWSAVQRKAKMTQCRADMNFIRTAVSQYQLNYQSVNMPFSLSKGTASDLLITESSTPSFDQLLQTFNGLNSAYNPRRIIMLEDGVATVDPWGNAYRVVLDLDADGDIDDAHVYGGAVVQKEVVVWSRGPDGLDNATDSDASNDDNVKSWEK